MAPASEQLYQYLMSATDRPVVSIFRRLLHSFMYINLITGIRLTLLFQTYYFDPELCKMVTSQARGCSTVAKSLMMMVTRLLWFPLFLFRGHWKPFSLPLYFGLERTLCLLRSFNPHSIFLFSSGEFSENHT